MASSDNVEKTAMLDSYIPLRTTSSLGLKTPSISTLVGDDSPKTYETSPKHGRHRYRPIYIKQIKDTTFLNVMRPPFVYSLFHKLLNIKKEINSTHFEKK
tara:strand:- start:100 stop:399 length:300 start_codon:yes stop_codon:yes gene_type:complete